MTLARTKSEYYLDDKRIGHWGLMRLPEEVGWVRGGPTPEYTRLSDADIQKYKYRVIRVRWRTPRGPDVGRHTSVGIKSIFGRTSEWEDAPERHTKHQTRTCKDTETGSFT